MASAEGARAVGIGWEPAPTPGWVAPHLEAEFPGLSLATVEVDGRPGRSPEPVRRRLRDLSDRLFGAEAIRLRGRPIPWAYRVFFRQIGLDPDRHRTPVEQLVLDRLQDGCFRSRGLPLDALMIATIETGVALRVFDADRLDGELCIRDAAPGEFLAGRSSELSTGRPPFRRHRGGPRGRAREPPLHDRGDRRGRGSDDRGRGGTLDCRLGPRGGLGSDHAGSAREIRRR
jgi:hypothetical protein